MEDPRAGAPALGLEPLTPQSRCLPMSSPLSSQFPPRDTGSDIIAFLPFLANYVSIFLIALVIPNPFASCQLVFSEKFYTCR